MVEHRKEIFTLKSTVAEAIIYMLWFSTTVRVILQHGMILSPQLKWNAENNEMSYIETLVF